MESEKFIQRKIGRMDFVSIGTVDAVILEMINVSSSIKIYQYAGFKKDAQNRNAISIMNQFLGNFLF